MNDMTLNVNNELEYFSDLWATRKMSPVEHSSNIWDERAKSWIDNLEPEDGENGAEDMHRRTAATAEYLKSRGLLGENDNVVDVGCGPGLFVLEFAKSVKKSVGIDYSARFTDYGREKAEALGIDNAFFEEHDFLTLDIDEAGLTGEFDLVFSSITPAATGEGCLEKLMRMSRDWCYNASFVSTKDSLCEKISREVFNEEYTPRWDGRGFYALMNLLWLSGYYPETFYYDDIREEVVEPNLHWAEKCATSCRKYSKEDTELVLRYLEKQEGPIIRHSLYTYGSILWNVNKKDSR